jgi:anti-anti-sigma factor
MSRALCPIYPSEEAALRTMAGGEGQRVPLRWCRADLEATDVGPVTVLRLTQAHLAGDALLAELGEDIVRLVRERGRHRLLFNVAAVEYATSALLGMYIRVRRAIQEVAGEMALCELTEMHAEVLTICGLMTG